MTARRRALAGLPAFGGQPTTIRIARPCITGVAVNQVWTAGANISANFLITFRQSFISTGAAAFCFGATGAVVSSDGSLSCGIGELVGFDGSSFEEADEVVSSDGSLFDGMDEVIGSDGSLPGGIDEFAGSDGSLFDGMGAAVGFDGSVFGAAGTDVR